MTPRRWTVPRGDYVACVTAAGLTERIAAQAEPCTARGAPDPAGRFVMIQSDSDPRRRPWGLLGFPPIPTANPLDDAPMPGLFDLQEGYLFT